MQSEPQASMPLQGAIVRLNRLRLDEDIEGASEPLGRSPKPVGSGGRGGPAVPGGRLDIGAARWSKEGTTDGAAVVISG